VNPSCRVFLPRPQLGARCRLLALDGQCGLPDCRIDYDGQAAGLYRYSYECVIAVEYLYKFIDSFVDEGRTGGPA
jgi:hypothetical protein